jgi:predicted transcriptional regulator
MSVNDGEFATGEIAAHFDITPQAASQTLRDLMDTGLLDERRGLSDIGAAR